MNHPIGDNGLVAVGQEQIAAKLNIANGTNHECIDGTIADVDALIGDLVIPPIGNGFIPLGNVEGFRNRLASYNKGQLCCAAHCNVETRDAK